MFWHPTFVLPIMKWVHLPFWSNLVRALKGKGDMLVIDGVPSIRIVFREIVHARLRNVCVLSRVKRLIWSCSIWLSLLFGGGRVSLVLLLIKVGGWRLPLQHEPMVTLVTNGWIYSLGCVQVPRVTDWLLAKLGLPLFALSVLACAW